jgi:transposase-like protein
MARYTREQRWEVLDILEANYGNVTLTAQQTGVPIRTLYAWKREHRRVAQQTGSKLQHTKNFPLLPENAAVHDDPPPAQPQTEAERAAEYTALRASLMRHINTLTATMIDDPDTAHLRAMALTRLLDRVIKLETLAAAQPMERTIRIEYEYGGAVHAVPPWQQPDD